MAPLYHVERRDLGIVDDAAVGQYHGDATVADAGRHHELSLKGTQVHLSLAKLAMTLPNHEGPWTGMAPCIPWQTIVDPVDRV